MRALIILLNFSIKFFKYATVLIALGGFCINSQAYTWILKTSITRVAVHDWGDVVFIYTSTPASQEGCPGNGKTLLLLRSNPQFKEIYAAALTAFHNKTLIGGFVYGCDSAHQQLPILQRIDLLLDENVTYP